MLVIFVHRFQVNSAVTVTARLVGPNWAGRDVVELCRALSVAPFDDPDLVEFADSAAGFISRAKDIVKVFAGNP